MLHDQINRFLLLCLLAGGVMPLVYGATPVESIHLLYSGNLDGELEPCGCSDEGNLGGIKRRASLLTQLRKQFPGVLVISAGGLIKSEGAGDQLKSDYILQGFRALNYDAVGLQWQDLSYGDRFILNAGVPWVASNWSDNAFIKQKTLAPLGRNTPVELVFFAWLDPAQEPARQMQGEHRKSLAASNALQQRLAGVKREGKVTILTTALPIDRIQAQFSLEDIDILLVKAAYERYGDPYMLEQTLVLQPGSRGMRLGHVELFIDSNARIQRWQHRVWEMPSSIPDAPALQTWYDNYNAKVKAAYLKRVALRKKRVTVDSPYAGEAQCKICHQAQHSVWQESAHATAFDALEAVSKSFDPACIQCHTVGFNQQGGFVDINMTDHLLNVQCESCHGPSNAHVKASGRVPVAHAGWPKLRVCGQCHTQPHSPSFQVDTYWSRIRH